MNEFVREIAVRIARETGIAEGEAEHLTEVPKDPRLGDYAFPCFALAGRLRQAPAAIAKELAAKLGAGEQGGEATAPRPPLFRAIEAVGPYVNFRVAPAAFARAVLSAVREQGDHFGAQATGRGATVVVDYSSPNIAKRFHVGHLRSTMIGAAICRLYEMLGYKVVRVNHLGDWGTQFGHLLSAWTKWGEEERLSAGGDPIGYLQELYVRHNQEAKADARLEDEARRWFKKLEDGDPLARSLWQRFRDISLAEFERIYELLGVRFDSYAGESFYEDKMPAAIRLCEEKGVAETGEGGALIVDFKRHGVDLPTVVLRKSDGATVYITRDVAALLYRFETYDPARVIYVHGAPQRDHFQQLFAIIKLLGLPSERCAFAPFGHVLGMSTREGTAILLDEVLGRAISLAREEVLKRDPEANDAEVERTARAVGVGAVIFADLKNKRTKNIEFDWERLVRFDGETGPYLQYTHARLAAILRNLAELGVEVRAEVDFSLLTEPETLAVLRAIEAFPRKIELAARELEPSLVSQHLLDLASALNAFYQKHRVKDAPTPELRAARALLVEATRRVLAIGLRLLGIAAPDKM